ncbi:serine protease [Penaeus vannamei]|uniref:Serine protease n=1 Tax=Penaeus vannamei TaxID=6689 RepID=A0A3R7PX15_PENVA|nr:serine protease [Penaeus vannamei]
MSSFTNPLWSHREPLRPASGRPCQREQPRFPWAAAPFGRPQGAFGQPQSFRVSGPQKFEKDPITGQFVPVGDRDSLSGAGLSGGLSQLPWLAQVVGPNLTLPLSLARNTNFQIARDQPDLMYQECRTPSNQYGRCRHLVYCMLPEFTSYQAFLPYGCPIQGKYVGACCPRPGPAVAPGFPPVPGQSQTPAPATNVDACGETVNVRIVGGEPTRAQEFPWDVKQRKLAKLIGIRWSCPKVPARPRTQAAFI